MVLLAVRAGAGATHNMILAINAGKLLGNVLCTVGTCIIDNHDFPCERAVVNTLPLVLTYCSENVLASSQTIMGRFRRSLYVGRMTLYLSTGMSMTWFIRAVIQPGFDTRASLCSQG